MSDITRDLTFPTPIFHGKIWGGRKLETEFGYEIPDGPIGECWAISAHPNGDCVVAEGPWAGRHLSELWDEHRELFGGVEGLLFLATPDILSGLAAWAYFDNNDPSAVSAPFGSGCSATLTAALAENRRGGRRAFIGLFDPSVRKHLPAGVLGFAVPMSRFREMCAAMRSTCLFGTPAWSAIRARIAASGD